MTCIYFELDNEGINRDNFSKLFNSNIDKLKVQSNILSIISYEINEKSKSIEPLLSISIELFKSTKKIEIDNYKSTIEVYKLDDISIYSMIDNSNLYPKIENTTLTTVTINTDYDSFEGKYLTFLYNNDLNLVFYARNLLFPDNFKY